MIKPEWCGEGAKDCSNWIMGEGQLTAEDTDLIDPKSCRGCDFNTTRNKK